MYPREDKNHLIINFNQIFMSIQFLIASFAYKSGIAHSYQDQAT